MPINNGSYEKLTEEEIQTRLENQLADKLGTEAPGNLVTAQIEAEAETLAQNQEEALKRVYESAYLEDATGKELDKLVSLINIDRKTATPATGSATFSRQTPAKSNYVIQSGVQIQTRGSGDIQFETTEQSYLGPVDNFESGNLDKWNGDIGDFSVVQNNSLSGSDSLQIPDISDAEIQTDESFTPGTQFTFEYKTKANSKSAFRFAVQDDSNYYEAIIDEPNNKVEIKLVVGGSVVTSDTSSGASIAADTKHYAEVKWGLYNDHEIVFYQTESKDTEVASASIGNSEEWQTGAISVVSLDSTAKPLMDMITVRERILNIEATSAGTETNLAPDTLTVMSGSIPGVEYVTNEVATGDPSNVNINFSPFVIGTDRESDEELRERAYETTSIGGAATATAIESQLWSIEGVKSVSLNRNRENSSVNGLPAHSFEAIVYGGSNEKIAEVLFDTESIDSNDVGGVNGTEETYDIQSDITGEVETMHWSRPTEIKINIDIELVVDENFIGTEEIKQKLTEQIGGTGLNGEFITGFQTGDDIYYSILKQYLVSPEENGIWNVNSLTLDKSGDGSDDGTTNANGAKILEIADSEVGITNARDGSISVTTVQK